MIAEAGLVVAGRLDTRPRHKRSTDAADALHAARSAEVTSLWRLRAAEDQDLATPSLGEADDSSPSSARTLHAFLPGAGVEVMGASDDVVHGGPTGRPLS